MSRAVALLIFLLAVPACYATDYAVGGTTGWDTSGDYTTWASGKTFSVGDSLSFIYGSSHTVDEVNKADYDSCTATNAISSFNNGNTTITLSKTGPHYFICSTPNHCSQGMKLAVSVSAAASSPPAPTGSLPPSTTPSPVSSMAPSPASSSPPSSAPGTTPSDLTPTSSKTPTTSTPTGNGAMGSFKRMDALVLGASIVFGPLLVLMG
ncbi:Plastocyanin-like protein [Cinnamomum micranthum f. kanehirae]|uniref:Plastocyanin-like protein n=1 Tax=Cinnamomum micranthum f. kanehirae TaxID=337451 RepID=A0A3S3QSA4_9MAGN|nr:Plastocyanin-like protein [Cinnamomum micranthum f. kanehirae]